MQISSLAYSDYIGRFGCGRVLEGKHRVGEPLIRTETQWDSVDKKSWTVTGTEQGTSTALWVTRGLDRAPVEEVTAGDIVWISAFKDITIGDTISSPELLQPALPPLEIEQPTVSMFFLINNGPFASQDGQAITLRQLKDRLNRELQVNIALRVEDLGRPDGLKVSGRGELHLGVLIEEMRREGLELCVSRPEVITQQDENGKLTEPYEQLVIDVPMDLQGVVIEKLAQRKGELVEVHNSGTGTIRMEYRIPTRGLIGYRTEFLTDTRGLGIMTSRFNGYGHWAGSISGRTRGSMISTETGPATTYALENLQQRGTMFVTPADKVYAGQIVGEHCRPDDLPCNPTKRKNLTNHRASSKDFEAVLKVPRIMSLDLALEWIADDELLEVTPKQIRIRKSVLSADERKKIMRKMAAAEADD
jgi:GTP-binding protein